MKFLSYTILICAFFLFSGSTFILHDAAFNGHTQEVKQLLERGFDVHAKNKNGFTPLHLAAQNGHTDVLNLLIDYKAEINAKNKKGNTPLNLATLKGNKDIVKILKGLPH